GSIIAFNSDRFIMLGNAPFEEFGDDDPMDRGSNTRKPLDYNGMVALAQSVLKLKGDDLLDSDKRFASLIAEEGDMHMWVNSELFAGRAIGMLSSMMKAGV